MLVEWGLEMYSQIYGWGTLSYGVHYLFHSMRTSPEGEGCLSLMATFYNTTDRYQGTLHPNTLTAEIVGSILPSYQYEHAVRPQRSSRYIIDQCVDIGAGVVVFDTKSSYFKGIMLYTSNMN